MSANASTAALLQSWNIPELNKRLKFVIFALALFVFGTHVPAPGIDHNLVENFFNSAGSGGLLGMIDIFSGGALKKFSIFALGIMPYINASIMMQLLVAIEPSLKAIQQEGEEGRKRISKITRYGAVILAFIQGAGLLISIYSQGTGTPLFSLGPITALFSIVAGTCFLMWLGDEITTKGVGNGTSIIIMIGIVASIPYQIYQELAPASMDSKRIGAVLMFGILVVLVVGAIVLIQPADRPQDLWRPKHLPADQGHPGGRHPDHLRHIGADGAADDLRLSRAGLWRIHRLGQVPGQHLVSHRRIRPGVLLHLRVYSGDIPDPGHRRQPQEEQRVYPGYPSRQAYVHLP
jgi:hypothetical protein